jgi:hypothetical protein
VPRGGLPGASLPRASLRSCPPQHRTGAAPHSPSAGTAELGRHPDRRRDDQVRDGRDVRGAVDQVAHAHRAAAPADAEDRRGHAPDPGGRHPVVDRVPATAHLLQRRGAARAPAGCLGGLRLVSCSVAVPPGTGPPGTGPPRASLNVHMTWTNVKTSSPGPGPDPGACGVMAVMAAITPHARSADVACAHAGQPPGSSRSRPLAAPSPGRRLAPIRRGNTRRAMYDKIDSGQRIN